MVVLELLTPHEKQLYQLDGYMSFVFDLTNKWLYVIHFCFILTVPKLLRLASLLQPPSVKLFHMLVILWGCFVTVCVSSWDLLTS